jgi:hypothetical protein
MVLRSYIVGFMSSLVFEKCHTPDRRGVRIPLIPFEAHLFDVDRLILEGKYLNNHRIQSGAIAIAIAIVVGYGYRQRTKRGGKQIRGETKNRK